MILYPRSYVKDVKAITLEFLNKNNIKALILDVDNTLIDYYKNMLIGVDTWCNELKQNGIKFCIVSNSNHKDKVEKVANKLGIPYIYFAKKPLKTGFKKAQEILKENNEDIACIGDQIFSDVMGANACKMYSILVEPVDKKDMLVTKIKRPLEKLIIRRYQKIERKDKNVF